MSNFMLSIKNGILISIFLLLFSVRESEAMNVFYYDISLSSQKEAKYKVLPNGIVKIKHSDYIIFVRPANKVLVADGQQFLLWSSKKEVSKLPFSEVYYPEGSSLILKPNYFYIEILLRSKKNGYMLYPKKLAIINSRGELIPATKYVVAEGRLEEPGNYGNSFLINFVPFNDNWFRVDEEQDENKFIKLPVGKLIGFAVRFDIPPPTPGDLFSINIQGLEFMSESVEVPIIYYDTRKTYIFEAN